MVIGADQPLGIAETKSHALITTFMFYDSNEIWQKGNSQFQVALLTGDKQNNMLRWKHVMLCCGYAPHVTDGPQ